MMNNNIKVINTIKQDDFKKIAEMYKDESINKTFDGVRINRLAAAEFAFLIYLNQKPIGFILLVRETCNTNFLDIDIAIKKEYQSKGYGKKALEIFRDNFLNLIQDDIRVEVSKKILRLTF